ncbi:MAG: GTP-binding protein [Gammaproteobacteria bacterium HGW-Gammaproteobacteria-10]|nr:MAG: GTP-binding protein [Gammaproteobacteria bacterium HGW-Gammaproteobacteria-3]PKM34927.1 MAG: GTP-binding protein [Gammaproteobacteria bacterium HGW-Gammaproteobacteria-10]
MDYDYSELVAKTKNWAGQAADAGWINQAAAQELLDIDARTPQALLGQGRPLMVAFMGGTGVGKSSLLNRLAGQAIARTGVERPTSKEVTLYHHRSLQMQQLPEMLPLEQIKTAYHDDDTKKHLIWIDMPDFDSTEQHNKEIVQAWLPYIDLLIYVVSPERYRDNKAWRMLQAEGNRHAWLFVLNQWDKGDAVQFDDFKKQLGLAGFDDPLIFRTICIEDKEDEFDALRSKVESLANENTIKQLNTRSTQVRTDALRQRLTACLAILGSDRESLGLDSIWQKRWQQTTETLHKGFVWPIKQLANFYLKHNKIPADGSLAIWDDWAQSLFEDALDDIFIQAEAKQLPTRPLKQQLSAPRGKAAKIVIEQSQLGMRQALANPGNKIQRFFLKLMCFCEIVLPLAAMSGVGYQLLTGFYDSSLKHLEYLGTDFAIHSTLLIAISWLVPFFIQKKLQPSLEKTALKGLEKGLVNAMALIEADVLEALAENRKQQRALINQVEAILADCVIDGPARSAASDKDLERMLID